ncbi:hypothetical protein FRC02_008329 [Tulasnella sp. 418]|nr:hypothetical protein FRC02_008329 [Tulasnella sp. 418]
MTESVWNYTILDTSPLIKYTPFSVGDLASGGWMSTCPTFVQGQSNSYWICDRGSAHTTSTGKISFEFDFSGIEVYISGNITGGFGYDVTIDKSTFTGNPKGSYIASFTNLDPGDHHLKITTRQSNQGATLTFTSATVVVGTSLQGATIEKSYVDDSDPQVVYDVPLPGNWTVNPIYGGTVGPDPTKISSSTFHESFSAGASATLKFKGAGILAYGACYSHSRYATYQATIDDESPSDWDGTVNLYDPNGQVKQRAGNCLRYARGGLDPSVEHTLKLNTKDPGRLAVDWYEIIGVSGGAGYNHVSAGGSSVPLGAIIGAACGGAALILLLIGLFFLYRRRQKKKAKVSLPTEGLMDTSPFAIVPPVTMGYDINGSGNRFNPSLVGTPGATGSLGGETSTSSLPNKQAMLQTHNRESFAGSSSNGLSDSLPSPGVWSTGLPSGAASPAIVTGGKDYQPYDPTSYFRDSTAGSSTGGHHTSSSGGGDRKGQIQEGGVLRLTSPGLDAPPAYTVRVSPPR